MNYLYHYGLEKNLLSIQASGIFRNHPYFTTNEYYNSFEAGQKLGVMSHNINCVLKFEEDGLFKKVQDVPSTGRFTGGGTQYQHPYRPKPIAIRKVNNSTWRNL